MIAFFIKCGIMRRFFINEHLKVMTVTNKTIVGEEISDIQLQELDELLASFENQNNCSKTKVNGDDSDMKKSVSEASKYVNNENDNQYFIENMMHINSLYSRC